MQSVNPPLLFTFEFDDIDGNEIKATNFITLPYLPKVNDEFTLQGADIYASMLVFSISYNISAKFYQVELDPSLTDWWGCDDKMLTNILVELRAQGWSISHTKCNT